MISVDTGKVLDVLYMTSSCVQCERMEEKVKKGEIPHLEYIEWFIQHEEQCYLNYDGSSAVSSHSLYNLCKVFGIFILRRSHT